MPKSPGINHGIQLWVNLCRDNKYSQPTYQEVRPEDYKIVPIYETQTSTSNLSEPEAQPITPSKNQIGNLSIFWGRFDSVSIPSPTDTPTCYYHLALEPKKSFELHIPEHWNGFVYPIVGSIEVGSEKQAKQLKPGDIAVLGPQTSLSPKTTPGPDGKGRIFNEDEEWKSLSTLQVKAIDSSIFTNSSEESELSKSIVETRSSLFNDKYCHLVIAFGRPLNEPKFNYGPFVLNSQEELYETIFLLRSGKFDQPPKIVKFNSESDQSETQTVASL